MSDFQVTYSGRNIVLLSRPYIVDCYARSEGDANKKMNGLVKPWRDSAFVLRHEMITGGTRWLVCCQDDELWHIKEKDWPIMEAKVTSWGSDRLPLAQGARVRYRETLKVDGDTTVPVFWDKDGNLYRNGSIDGCEPSLEVVS